jgi:hypothetical protein
MSAQAANSKREDEGKKGAEKGSEKGRKMGTVNDPND